MNGVDIREARPGDARTVRAIRQRAAAHLTERYGAGPSHRGSDTVERLLLLELDGEAVRLVDRPPVQLELDVEGRNWEGLVRWEDRGLLVVTDEFPETILAFVPLPGA